MFERFTERARQVVILGQHQAREMKHTSISDEHILLGLILEEEGAAAKTLVEFGTNAQEVREKTISIAGEGKNDVYGQIPFEPQSRMILELALREALSLGHNYIGTEHLLLGLLRYHTRGRKEANSTSSQVMQQLNLNSEVLREAVLLKISPKGSVQTPRFSQGIQVLLDTAIEQRDRQTKTVRKLRMQLRAAQKEEAEKENK